GDPSPRAGRGLLRAGMWLTSPLRATMGLTSMGLTSMLLKSRVGDDDGRREPREDLRHDAERAAGDPASARLLARMARVEDRHAGSRPREAVGGPRAGRSRAHDEDVGGHPGGDSSARRPRTPAAVSSGRA